MKRQLQELGRELLGLPPDSRAYLAARLLESLDVAEADHEVDHYDQLWKEEAKKRLAEMREGKVTPIPLEEVLRDIKARLGH